MKTKYSLMQMRDVWLDAWRNGDIDQLNFVESLHFFIKHGDAVRTKPQHLARMRAYAAEHAARQWGMTYEDEVRHVVERGEWATVSGINAMRRNGRLCARHEFMELWLICDARWQIAALCYEHKEIGHDVDAG
ncbi:nuclear transport factor 2 family protein [Burkholderia sp. SRS-46]|nr:nuclear transport factor 2 family protein [Burkholderia sp. SRS-46]